VGIDAALHELGYGKNKTKGGALWSKKSDLTKIHSERKKSVRGRSTNEQKREPIAKFKKESTVWGVYKRGVQVVGMSSPPFAHENG